MFVCECCMMMAESGDDSSCRGYWEHDHAEPAGITWEHVLVESWEATLARTCDSCGGEIGAFGAVYHYTKI